MIQTNTGLRYEDKKIGTGSDATVGKSVAIHYTCWITGYGNDPVKIGETVRSDPFWFTIGKKTVIQGWDEAVRGMKAGGIRLAMIPPHLGYGAEGLGRKVPPNSHLITEIELLIID
jgi:FKBP-type peptidyl-prolyl cis-trans isomerase